MLTKGFHATSVDEVCEAAKLTKGSFFHYFQSKEELARAVLGYHGASIQALMNMGSYGKIRDPLQRVYGYLEYLAALSRDPSVPRSCLFGNFSQELSSTHPTIRADCADAFARWADALRRDLAAAKSLHAPGADFDPRRVAEHFLAVYEGALILAKARQQPRVIGESIGHFRRYLEQLFDGRRPHTPPRERGQPA